MNLATSAIGSLPKICQLSKVYYLFGFGESGAKKLNVANPNEVFVLRHGCCGFRFAAKYCEGISSRFAIELPNEKDT